MRNLLSADLTRLRRDKGFWLLLGLTLATAYFLIMDVGESIASASINTTLDDYFFQMLPYLSLIQGVFISLFLGTERCDGPMRNKLIVGHSRLNVYFANYFTCLMAGLALSAAWLLGTAPGFWLAPPLVMEARRFLGYLLVTAAISAAWTAVFTAIGMLSGNKALTVVFALGVWIALTLVGSGVCDLLEAPETVGGMAYINGEFVWQELEPNPRYVTGAARTALLFLRDLLPSGPAIRMTDAALEDFLQPTVLGLWFTAIVSAGGYLLFRRKDLK